VRAPVLAALEYAERGWHVFPVRGRSKVPLTAHGFHDASTSAAQIENWWARWPKANIGIACGFSKLLVVDLDGEEGRATWPDLAVRNGEQETTLVCETGGGGLHLYFAGEGRCTTRHLGKGIDTRGHGGSVIAPPSLHVSGKHYRWRDRSAPLAPAPSWLLSALEPPPRPPVVHSPRSLPPGENASSYGRAALDRITAEVLSASEGVRHDTLFRAALQVGSLEAGNELVAEPALDVLREAARAVGLGTFEIERTVRDGFSVGQQHPSSRLAR